MMYKPQTLSKKQLKIAVLSLADIDNYGDTFFPYLFRGELLKRLPSAQVELYTNLSFDCGLYQTRAFSQRELEDYDAVILAGGETIQRLDDEEWNPIYSKISNNTYSGRPTDIVFSWLTIKNPFKSWFAVGVHPNILVHLTDIEDALANLDYLAVRGLLSKKIIENSFVDNNVNIHIVPDLGWLFPEYIDTSRLKLKKILKMCGISDLFLKPYAVFEMFTESGVPVDQIAHTLVQFQSKSGLRVLLVPFIRPWSDYTILSQIQEASGGELVLVPNSLNFLETGILLRGSEFFIGGSMHGAVTCLAYGKPAANILRWTAPKLQDLHGIRNRTDCFSNDWGQLHIMLDMLNDERKLGATERAAFSNYMRMRLAREIDRLCEKILEHLNSRR